jgi:hypothetical protein
VGYKDTSGLEFLEMAGLEIKQLQDLGPIENSSSGQTLDT